MYCSVLIAFVDTSVLSIGLIDDDHVSKSSLFRKENIQWAKLRQVIHDNDEKIEHLFKKRHTLSKDKLSEELRTIGVNLGADDAAELQTYLTHKLKNGSSVPDSSSSDNTLTMNSLRNSMGLKSDSFSDEGVFASSHGSRNSKNPTYRVSMFDENLAYAKRFVSI